MATFYSPEGNPEVWDEKPEGYFTPGEWAAAHPAPEPDPIPLDELRRLKIERVDARTAELILAGFDYAVGEQTYHFGYDAEDQSNFTMAALAATLSLIQSNAAYRQVWRGWQGDSVFNLEFSATEFLALAEHAGKTHKENCLGSGWVITEQIRNAQTREELEAIGDNR